MARKKRCEFDEEVGGMVEVDDPDTDWLNGRAPMPHENCPPASHVHDRPLRSQVCLNHNPVPVRREFLSSDQ